MKKCTSEENEKKKERFCWCARQLVFILTGYEKGSFAAQIFTKPANVLTKTEAMTLAIP